MTELDTMYRVMILYMLNLVEYPLTNTQITNFVLEKAYHVHKEGDYHVLKGVVSRKKQLIPMFMSAMQEQ